MNKLRLSVAMLALLAVGILAGCSSTTASPEGSDSIRKSLDQAGLQHVSVNQDRDKGIVTIGGTVTSEDDKAKAESIARSIAGGQVVANQIAVVPVGVEKEAKAVNSDLDKGIEVNLDAAQVGAVIAWHFAAEMQAELLPPGGAQESVPFQRRLAIAGDRRFEAQPQIVFPARRGRVKPAASRPSRHGMKVAAEIEIPRRQ